MRKTREILRQKWQLARSHREVAVNVGRSLGAIIATLKRAEPVQLDRSAIASLSDTGAASFSLGMRWERRLVLEETRPRSRRRHEGPQRIIKLRACAR